MKKYWIRKIPFVIAMVALGILVFSGIVMMLWNGILPSVLHVGAITFWQAAGLLLLVRILFGGFRGKRRMGGCRERHTFMNWGNTANCGQKTANVAE